MHSLLLWDSTWQIVFTQKQSILGTRLLSVMEYRSKRDKPSLLYKDSPLYFAIQILYKLVSEKRQPLYKMVGPCYQNDKIIIFPSLQSLKLLKWMGFYMTVIISSPRPASAQCQGVGSMGLG